MDHAGTTGGSNAQDFQPQTRNPQNNVGGGLQPNAASPGSLFQQPNTDQQMLPSTHSLRVLNNGMKNTSSPVTPQTTNNTNGWGVLPLGLGIIIVIIGAVILRSKTTKTPPNEPTVTTELDALSPSTPKPAPKKAKKKPKAKRKNSNKK